MPKNNDRSEVAPSRCVSYIFFDRQDRDIPLTGFSPMQPLYGQVAALAVVAIFYIWRNYFRVVLHRQQSLRCRVAYLLWVMANDAGRELPEALTEIEKFALPQDGTVPS